MTDNTLSFISRVDYKANPDVNRSIYKVYYNEFKQIVKLYDIAFSSTIKDYLSGSIKISGSVIPFNKGGIIKYKFLSDEKNKPLVIEPLLANADEALSRLNIILEDEADPTNEDPVKNIQLKGTVILMAKNMVFLLKDSTEDEWSVGQAEDDVFKVLEMLKYD